jgi:type II secretory pathway component PulF
MSSGDTVRWLRTIHATAVAAVVAAGIYIYVPPFAPVFAAFGPDIPLSARFLMVSYPFAFLLPLAAFASGLRVDPSSRWRRLFVPSTYVAAIAVIAFVVWALYAPVFELSATK